MLHDVLVQPLINLVLAIYAMIPGHDFGVAITIFTILVRLALWPLVRKQIRQQKALRELQPELKKIKAKSKGDKQQEAMLVMELYREREINPFASIGLLLIQLPIFLALFFAVRTILEDGQIAAESYTYVKELGQIQNVLQNPGSFDPTLFGVIHLNKPHLFLAFTAAAAQYIQTKQLMPRPKERKKLREILKKSAQTGDNSEAIAAMNQGMGSFFSVLMFAIAATLPSALALYWTTGSLVAVLQQRVVLRQDVQEAEDSIPEAEVINEPPKKKKPAKKAKKRSGGKKK